MIDRYNWMSLSDVVRSIPAMHHDDNVSMVARGVKDSTQTKEGFIEAYLATNGSIDKMSKRTTGRLKKGQEIETWADRRNQFVSRHLEQMRKGDTYKNGWLPTGEPTRRHLGLIAWAYTPSPKRLKAWLKTQPTLKSGEWKKYVGEIKSNPSQKIRSAIHLIDEFGVNKKIGYVTFSDSNKGLKIDVDVKNLPDGEHGFHIHEFGNLAPKLKDGKWVSGLSAGQHFDPYNAGFHGSPTGDGHLGDLPFITVKNGISKQTVYAPRLKGKLNEIKNRSIIIHKCGDNYSDYPLPNGGGKSRIAGGIITNECIYCSIRKNPFDAKSLEKILYQSYKRGVGAWKSGHRKFQSPQSWGFARVNSFLVGGNTFFSADNDLAMELPDDLYNAIVDQRVSVPIPKSDEKVVKDYKGNLIQEKYLIGYKGKEIEKRIKEISERRKEYEQVIKKYKTESKIPIKIKQRLYRAWETDKGDSKVKSPYTIAASKRGFTPPLTAKQKRERESKDLSGRKKTSQTLLNKAEKALEYYREAIKNPMTKESFISQKVTWKRVGYDGMNEATIDGKVYDMYRDTTDTPIVWREGDKTKKHLNHSKTQMDVLGNTKQESTKELLKMIWSKMKSKDHFTDIELVKDLNTDYVFDVKKIPYSSLLYAIEETNDESFASKEEMERSFLSHLGSIQDVVVSEYDRIDNEIQKYADITKLEMINTSRWRKDYDLHIDLFFTPFTVAKWDDGEYKVFQGKNYKEIFSSDNLSDAKSFTIDYAYKNRKDLLDKISSRGSLPENRFGEYLLSADKDIWEDILSVMYDEWIMSEIEENKDSVLKYAYEEGLNQFKKPKDNKQIFTNKEISIIENLSDRFSSLLHSDEDKVLYPTDYEAQVQYGYDVLMEMTEDIDLIVIESLYNKDAPIGTWVDDKGFEYRDFKKQFISMYLMEFPSSMSMDNEEWISKINEPFYMLFGIKYNDDKSKFLIVIYAYTKTPINNKLRSKFKIEEEFSNLEYPPVNSINSKLKKEMKTLTHQKKMKIEKLG